MGMMRIVFVTQLLLCSYIDVWGAQHNDGDVSKYHTFLHRTHTYEFNSIEYRLSVNENLPTIDNAHKYNHSTSDESILCDVSSKSIAGYMDVEGSKYDEDRKIKKHLFFWMFEKRGSAAREEKDVPFIVWLTGGPGCSSTLALLTENGPCQVNKNGKTTRINPYSWTNSAHVLWLDQPAGVGFSYGETNVKNETMVSEDVYYFLQTFFYSYPKYLQSPLYIVGESYGGHYVPAIAHRIYIGNKKVINQKSKNKKLQKLKLAGLAIGNGSTKPEEQRLWIPDMLYNNSHHIQLINETEYHYLKSIVAPRCSRLIHTCNTIDAYHKKFACQQANAVCKRMYDPFDQTGLNPYDIRIKCKMPPLCYNFTNINEWLNLPQIQKVLNVHNRPHHWEPCNFNVTDKFRDDKLRDFSNLVAMLLNANIPVLIYAGDADFMCNYFGNKGWTVKLNWKQQSEFQSAIDHPWGEGNLGLARTTSNGLLTFLQVYDAGHMVPSDQPKVALQMITNFVNGGKF